VTGRPHQAVPATVTTPASLFVQRWGSGRPVVFLHGLGASYRYWARLAQLGSGYAGIAPDLLGFGHSPEPPESTYDVAAHLEMLLPVIPDGAVIVGHSAGAVLAAGVAAARPAGVAGLLLLGLPAFSDDTTARDHIRHLGLLPRLTVDGTTGAKLICHAMCALRPLLRRLGPKLADLPPEVASDFFARTWPSYSGTLPQVVVGHRVLPDLLAARTPTVLVGAWDDRDAPPRHLLSADQALVGAGLSATLRVVNGDHHLSVRQPMLVEGLLEGILDRFPAEDLAGFETSRRLSATATTEPQTSPRPPAP